MRKRVGVMQAESWESSHIVSFASSGYLVRSEDVFILDNLKTDPQTLPDRLAIIFGCSKSLALDSS